MPEEIYVLTHGELMDYMHIAYFENPSHAVKVWRLLVKNDGVDREDLDRLNPRESRLDFTYDVIPVKINEWGVALPDINGVADLDRCEEVVDLYGDRLGGVK